MRPFPEAPWVTLLALDQSLSGQTEITINLPSTNSTLGQWLALNKNQDSVNKEVKRKRGKQLVGNGKSSTIVDLTI